MIAKLNIVTTLAALVLFLFPWLDVQCSAKSFATQSGIQTIYGGATPTRDLKEFSNSVPSSKSAKETVSEMKKKESIDPSILAGIALLAVIGAVVLAFRHFISSKKSDAVGILCAVALIVLIIQMMADFPIRSGLAEAMAQDSGSARSNDSFANAGNEMAKMLLLQIQIKYRPAFYLELLALGIPTLILANSLLDKLKKREPVTNPEIELS